MGSILHLYPGWVSISVGSVMRRRLVEDIEILDSEAEREAERVAAITGDGVESSSRLPREKLVMLEELMVKGELINQVRKLVMLDDLMVKVELQSSK